MSSPRRRRIGVRPNHPGACRCACHRLALPAGRLLDPESKPLLRRRCRQRRLAVLPGVQAAIAAAAVRQIPPLLPAAAMLGLYWPLPGEADLGALSGPLAGRLALPAIEPSQSGAATIAYRPWGPQTPLRPDLCGIPAPDPSAGPVQRLGPAQLGLLLVPALALDAQGIRLGSGGGWYDRLRADATWRAVPALAVLPAACLVDSLPRDPWDVPFPGWLDERGVHWL